VSGSDGLVTHEDFSVSLNTLNAHNYLSPSFHDRMERELIARSLSPISTIDTKEHSMHQPDIYTKNNRITRSINDEVFFAWELAIRESVPCVRDAMMCPGHRGFAIAVGACGNAKLKLNSSHAEAGRKLTPSQVRTHWSDPDYSQSRHLLHKKVSTP
jgi:hypothetical protein